MCILKHTQKTTWALSQQSTLTTAKIPATSLTNRQLSKQPILSQFHQVVGKDSQELLSSLLKPLVL